MSKKYITLEGLKTFFTKLKDYISDASVSKASRATSDENGNRITTTYCKQTGTYSNLTAGNATVATNYNTTSGTIQEKFKSVEERLKSLGFKKGSIKFFGTTYGSDDTGVHIYKLGNMVMISIDKTITLGSDYNDYISGSKPIIEYEEEYSPYSSLRATLSMTDKNADSQQCRLLRFFGGSSYSLGAKMLPPGNLSDMISDTNFSISVGGWKQTQYRCILNVGYLTLSPSEMEQD